MRIVLLSCIANVCLGFQYFNNIPRFPSEGIFQVDIGKSLKGFFIAAFGDFNEDFKTDVVLIHEDMRTVRIHLWDVEAFDFTARYYELKSKAAILNVIPSDYDYDGRLDLLVLTEDGEMVVHFGTGDGFSDALSLGKSGSSQPILVDYYGNRRVQLLGTPEGESRSLLWQVSSEKNRSSLLRQAEGELCKSPHKHWNGFVDFNDLFLMCDDGTFRILVSDQGTFRLRQAGKFPDNVETVLFADVNGDGAIDIVYLTCGINDCTINVSYNQRKVAGLCIRDDGFAFNFETTSEFVSRLSISSFFSERVKIQINSKFPQVLQAADLNLDGFPDFLTVVRHENGTTYPVLLQNVACDQMDASAQPSSSNGNICLKGKRGLKIWTQGTETLRGLRDVEQATFFDLGERGAMDIVITLKRDGMLQLMTLFNNFFNDAFFLKAMLTNGVCFKYCSGAQHKKPLGTNYPGATFMYTILDTRGYKRAAVSFQLAQTAHFSYSKPYSFAGLGRTNNYIEEFTAGVQGSGEYLHNWNGLIPNSQLLIHPPSSSEASSKSFEWSLELYISPGDYALNVLIVLVISTALLTGVVIFLRYLEKREDEAERRKALHVINFDAM